jgi:hypothetical protein
MKTLISSLLLMSLIGCQVQNDSSSSSNGTHTVTLKLGAYQTAGLMDYLIPSAYANVSELKACFKRLRFKKTTSDSPSSSLDDSSSSDDSISSNDSRSSDDSSSSDDSRSSNDSINDVEDNIDFNIGEVTLTSSGTLLGSVNLPEGTYYRVEFDLEPSCAGKSLKLTNEFGTYSSTEKIKIKFDGVLVIDGSKNVELGVQEILDAANDYRSGSMADHFENVSGSL